MKRILRAVPEWLDPWLVAGAAVAACVLQAMVYGVPVPAVHDEFSYLLAADTFAHGRCTNPPHPLWQHFETMHVLQQPTYASKYPPGQGLFLAAGQVLTGYPVVGVWLGVGLACAAGTWTLRAYMPRRWALVGGLLMAARLGFSTWGWSYWGGGVAAAGGALLVGGWVRTLRRPHWQPSALLAVGLVLLAVSRPFEGLLLCLPVGVATSVWLVRRPGAGRALAVQILPPALAVLVPAGLALAYQNQCVTGNPLRLPYMEHAAQYDVAPPLLIQSRREPIPTYRHKEIQQLHADEDRDYRSGQVFEFWRQRALDKLELWWRFYLGYGLSVPLLALPWTLWGSRRTRFALAACVVVFGVVATLETWGSAHYTAPVAALVYLVVVQCCRRIARVTAGGWRVGRWVVRPLLTGCLLVPALSVVPPLHAPAREWVAGHTPEWLHAPLLAWMTHSQPPAWAVARAQLERDRVAEGGRHLILVDYEKGHSIHQEWVFNKADINTAAVVWARPMGPAGADELANYFTDRTIWLLNVGAEKAGELVPLRPPVRPTRPPPRR